MNNITGAALTSFPSRVFRSSGGCSTVVGGGIFAIVCCSGKSDDPEECVCKALFKEGGLAPEMRVRILLSFTRTKNGTAVTSNVSAKSPSSSASIYVTSKDSRGDT